jgi:hypothetical protein
MAEPGLRLELQTNPASAIPTAYMLLREAHALEPSSGVSFLGGERKRAEDAPAVPSAIHSAGRSD